MARRYGIILGILLIPITWSWTSQGDARERTSYPFPEMRYFPPMPLPDDGPVTREGVELGRMLFHDPILGKDSSIACSGCHQQRHAFADGPVQVSVGVDGTPMTRNTPPLFNLAWYTALFWDGRAPTIEEQALHPVRDAREMGSDWRTVTERIARHPVYPGLFKGAFGGVELDSNLVARALGQFLRSLISADSPYDRMLRGEVAFTEDEMAGFVIANEQDQGDCLQCHTTDRDALGTDGTFRNNGLDPASSPLDNTDMGLGGITGKASDMGRFKVPSLRNVALTAPYMHDGRFATLEEVVDFYSDGVHAGVNTDPRMGNARRGGARLDSTGKRQLLAFLHTLTDSTFISDPRHGDPWATRKVVTSGR